MAESSQSSSSSSTSTPTFLETPENAIIDQISSVASGLAQQMVGWAQGVFAQTSQITNQAVGNFFQTSQNMLGLSNNLTGQYNNLFAPENAQLVADANSFNSAARQKVDMGMAGATQAQAGDQALKSSEEALRSYGIDPSSGRYAALDKAAAVQNAANVAGAENMQRNADVATGQRLRSEAVQVGAQLPAAIANVNNTAIQANTGASNATLANANTGANLMRLPNDFLKTAMDVKLPPTGQNTKSTSQGSGQSSSPDRPGSSGGGQGPGGGGAGSGGGGSSGPRWDNPANYGGGGAQATGVQGRPSAGTAAHIMNVPPYGDNTNWNDPTGQNYDPMSGIDPNSFSGNNDYYQPQSGYNMDVGQPGTNAGIDWTGGGGGAQNPFEDPGFGQNYDFGGPDQTFTGGAGGANTEWGNINYDPNANAVDPGWQNNYDQPAADTNWGSGADQYTGGSSQSYDTSSPSSDFSAGDYMSGSADDMGGAYALGGAIPQKGTNRHAYKGPRNNFMANGGQVPDSASPSGGQQVDDVQAQGPGGSNINLNADEFVIPRDVALWKGQEFFQNLIMQSRKKRVTAPAHGTPAANEVSHGSA